jgi:hypothetical protein
MIDEQSGNLQRPSPYAALGGASSTQDRLGYVRPTIEVKKIESVAGHFEDRGGHLVGIGQVTTGETCWSDRHSASSLGDHDGVPCVLPVLCMMGAHRSLIRFMVWNMRLTTHYVGFVARPIVRAYASVAVIACGLRETDARVAIMYTPASGRTGHHARVYDRRRW